MKPTAMVNLDEVIVSMRELLSLSRNELLTLTKNPPRKVSRENMVVNLIEAQFKSLK